MPISCFILSEMLGNSKYDAKELEYEKQTILRELQETQKDQFETTIEFSHKAVIISSKRKDWNSGL